MHVVFMDGFGGSRGRVSMSSLTQNNVQSDQRGFRPGSTDSRRFPPLHMLFIHRDADTVECCLQELKKAQFTVSADIALNLAQTGEESGFTMHLVKSLHEDLRTFSGNS
jgi:hypothetical protein